VVGPKNSRRSLYDSSRSPEPSATCFGWTWDNARSGVTSVSSGNRNLRARKYAAASLATGIPRNELYQYTVASENADVAVPTRVNRSASMSTTSRFSATQSGMHPRGLWTGSHRS